MLKLILTGAVVAGGLAGIVWSANSYLSIDDLKECMGPEVGSANCAPADVIVAISGGDTQARTNEAIKLYKAGWAPKLIFSGAALDTSGPSNAEAMRNQALESGVPDGDIILDKFAVDTSENATGTASLLSNRDRRVILVTSPYHQRRASIEFQRVFGDAITVVNHPTSTDRNWGANWWLTSTGWLLAFSETVKTVVVSAWR
ncbi:MAG TPA: YdcF family protein [Candidatus Saccharimonadales bacterium]|nr:YdcF family protein [Candidatus Saccharimonadales bacterium]